MSEWISVDTNIPEKGIPVLTFNSSGEKFDIARYIPKNPKDFWLNQDGFWITVTHWKPLPGAPKIEQTKGVK